jgi:hypothetical protein
MNNLDVLGTQEAARDIEAASRANAPAAAETAE